jgi:hypothetical protein
VSPDALILESYSGILEDREPLSDQGIVWGDSITLSVKAGVRRRRSAEQVPDVAALPGVHSRRLKQRVFTQFLVVG